MKNKLILVAGHSAAGKSTFARRLSRKLGIPCFTKDEVREAMGNGFGEASGVMQDRGNTDATINIMAYIAECFLQIGQVCILEANFRPPYDAQMEGLVRKYDADCLTFLFGGDMEVFWDRYMQRQGERHWVHTVVGQSKSRFIHGGIQAGFGDFAVGKTVKVDATDFNAIDYDGLFAIAHQFIAGSAEH